MFLLMCRNYIFLSEIGNRISKTVTGNIYNAKNHKQTKHLIELHTKQKMIIKNYKVPMGVKNGNVPRLNHIKRS